MVEVGRGENDISSPFVIGFEEHRYNEGAMKTPNVKLTDTQRANMRAIYDAINALAEDKDFIKKMTAAHEMVDEQIDDTNEDDYMELMNFNDNVHDLMRDSFP
jgi:Spy/CpxP family protein refolding chaperone